MMNDVFNIGHHVHLSGHGRRRPFVPALGFTWLTPVYQRLGVLTQPILRGFLERADIQPCMAVLDLGCGTGTLALLVKRAQPTTRVVGLDLDPAVLDVADANLTAAGVDVTLHRAGITDAGLEPGSFDRVVTTFVLHHLSTEEKRSVLVACRRVLRPGGEIHVADLGEPHTRLMRLLSLPLRWFGGERLAANLSGRIPTLMRAAGFSTVTHLDANSSPLGTITHWRGTVPELTR